MENDEGGKRAWEAERSISDVSKAIRNKALAQKVHDSASSKILFGHIPSRNIEQRILNMEIKANNEELWGVGVRGRGFMARTVERTPLVTKYWFGQGTTPYAGNSKGGPYPKEGHEKLYPGGAIDEMPDWITELVIKPIEEDGMVPEGWINSAVVLIYLPGGCIESHIDPPHLFRRPIITASFLSDTHLSFGCKFSSSSRAGPAVTQIPCRRGSVLSMAGFAADEISHCIRPEDINLRRAVIVLRHCPETAPRMTDEELGDLTKAEMLSKMQDERCKTAKKEPSPKRSRRRSGRSRSRSRSRSKKRSRSRSRSRSKKRSRSRSKKRSRSRSKKRSRSPKRSRSRSSKKVSRSRSRSGPRRPRSPVRTHTRAGVRRSSSSRDREEDRRKRNRERSVLPGKWGAGSVKKEDEDQKPTHHPTAALKFPKLESQPGSRVHDWCKQEGGGGGQGDKPYPEYQGRMVSSVMMGGDRCYKCQEKGHFARECPNKSEDRCFNCERDGHFIKDCPEPKRPRKERDSGAPPRWPMKEKHIRPKKEEEEVKERSRSPISRSRQLEEVLKLQKRKDEVLKRLETVRPRITKEEVKKEDDGLGDVSLTVEKIIAGDGSDHETEKETFLQKIERIKAKLGDELGGDESNGGEQPDMKSLLKKLLQKEDVEKEDKNDTPEESAELKKLQERISSEEDKLKKIMSGEVFEDNEESDKEDGELEEDVEAEEAEESEAEKELGGEISELRKELRLLKKRLRDDDVEVSEEEGESVDDKSDEEDFSEDEGDKENLDEDEDSEGEEDENVEGKQLQNAFELIKQTTAKSILSEKSKTWKAPKGSQTKLMNRILKSRLTDMQLEVEDSDEELEKERKIQEEEHARRKRRRSSKESRRPPPEQRQETYRRDKFEKVRQKLRGDSSSDDDEVIKKGKRSEFETMRRKMEKKQRDRMRDGERTRREEEEREVEREKKRRKVAEVTRMEERERSRRRSKERRRSRSRDRRRSRSSEWRRSPPRRRSRERISARELRSRSPLESKFKYSEKYSTTSSGYDRGAVLKRAEERYRKAGLVKAFDESSHEDESSEGDERSGSESPAKNFSLAGILKAEMETKEKIKKETDKIRKTAVLKDIAPLKNLFAKKSEKKEEEKSRLSEALS